MRKRFIVFILVIALLCVPTFTTAFAADQFDNGPSGLQKPVTLNGTTQPLQISITHPVEVDYTLAFTSNAYGKMFSSMQSPDIAITNNTAAPVKISVLSFQSQAGGDVQFVDVPWNSVPGYNINQQADWTKLTTADSEKYICLFLDFKNRSDWVNPMPLGSYVYSYITSPQQLGTLNSGISSSLKLQSNNGSAFKRAITAKHSLVLQFNLA